MYETDNIYTINNNNAGTYVLQRLVGDVYKRQSQDRAANIGYQVTQMISAQLPWARLFADVQGSYFFTEDYDSRVYASESGLLYTFYTPSFHGRGFRCKMCIRDRFKAAATLYIVSKTPILSFH